MGTLSRTDPITEPLPSGEHFQKDVIVEKGPEITLNSSSSKALTQNDIIQHIKPKFQENAEKLLKALMQYQQDFNFDNNGTLLFFNFVLNFSSIKHSN